MKQKEGKDEGKNGGTYIQIERKLQSQIETKKR